MKRKHHGSRQIRRCFRSAAEQPGGQRGPRQAQRTSPGSADLASSVGIRGQAPPPPRPTLGHRAGLAVGRLRAGSAPRERVGAPPGPTLRYPGAHAHVPATGSSPGQRGRMATLVPLRRADTGPQLSAEKRAQERVDVALTTVDVTPDGVTGSRGTI